MPGAGDERRRQASDRSISPSSQVALRDSSEPLFFRSPAELRAWFEENHESAPELLVGYYRKFAGEATITWSESVEEALCFGWIDGVRRGIDERSYSIRFTPRRRGSVWSAVNIRKIAELSSAGLMKPAGQKVYADRDPVKQPGYSYEKTAIDLEPELESLFRVNTAAWDFHSAQPPGYRRLASLWVMSAKRTETRQRRLAQLVESSAGGRRLASLTGPAGSLATKL